MCERSVCGVIGFFPRHERDRRNWFASANIIYPALSGRGPKSAYSLYRRTIRQLWRETDGRGDRREGLERNGKLQSVDSYLSRRGRTGVTIRRMNLLSQRRRKDRRPYRNTSVARRVVWYIPIRFLKAGRRRRGRERDRRHCASQRCPPMSYLGANRRNHSGER